MKYKGPAHPWIPEPCEDGKHCGIKEDLMLKIFDDYVFKHKLSKEYMELYELPIMDKLLQKFGYIRAWTLAAVMFCHHVRYSHDYEEIGWR